jgi:uncharacterized protein YxjI
LLGKLEQNLTSGVIVFQYPLHLTFKVWTLAPNRVSVTDNQGNLVFVVRQKAFKLKENIIVFGDEKLTKTLYEIKADRIIDFSARYSFSDAQGRCIGAVKRQGMKSFWRARFDVFAGDNNPNPVMMIQEDNPWLKICDALLSEIPVVGMFTGYFCNPTYTVSGADGKAMMRLEKKPGFLSRHFTIKMVDNLNTEAEIQSVLSILMMILLERQRG